MMPSTKQVGMTNNDSNAALMILGFGFGVSFIICFIYCIFRFYCQQKNEVDEWELETSFHPEELANKNKYDGDGYSMGTPTPSSLNL